MAMHGGSIALLLLLAGCTCQRERAPVSARLGQEPRVLRALGTEVCAADRGAGGRLAVGTPGGAVLLGRIDADQGPVALETEDGPVHDRAVAVLRFSRDGRRLLSVGGSVAAVWDTGSRRLLQRVKGPQAITAAALLPAGDVAFFGTAHGHVLRWQVSRPRALAVKRFACGGTHVPPARMRLAKDQRCRYGHYIETAAGPPACVYPVTQLVLLGERRLARVCRTGEGAVLELDSRRLRFFSPGHLLTLAPVGQGDLLLGRADGQLRLFSLPRRELVRTLLPAGAPSAAAASGSLIAAAQGRWLRLWHAAGARALARAPLPARAVWLELGPQAVRLLVADGRLLTYSLRVESKKSM